MIQANEKSTKSNQSENKIDIKGCLSEKQWMELVAIEYALTWGYGNKTKNEKRYNKLSNKRWQSMNRN